MTSTDCITTAKNLGVKMGRSNPVRGVVFLYFSSFSEMGLSFLFWIVITRLANPIEVGIASTVISISALVLGLADMGIARGLPRFLGESYGQNDFEAFRKYLVSSVHILAVSTFIAASFILVISRILETMMDFSFLLVIILASIISFANLGPPFKAALVSLVRTDLHSAVNVTSGLAKVAVGVVFVAIGFGSLGILLGVFASYMVSLFFSMAATWYLLRKEGCLFSLKGVDFETEKGVFRAGVPSYIPEALQHIGVKIGILLVFGAMGAGQTALYYMALQIYGVAAIIPSVIMELLFPYVSGLKERDSELVDRGIRFALMLSMPVVLSLVLYAHVPLSILGSEYVMASDALRILSLSIPLLAITGGVSILAYARGKYRLVLAIGIATNAPRVVLYLLLVPILSSIGASCAFLIGAVTGLIASVLAAMRMDFSYKKATMVKIALPSILLSVIALFLNLDWVLGSLLILLVSFFVVMRTRILPRRELVAVGKMILPQSVLENHLSRLRYLVKLIYGN